MHSGHALIRRPAAAAVVVALLLGLLSVTVLVGCGKNTPEGAVSKYINALQSGDWEAFKATVVSQNLSKEQDALAKDKFEQVKIKFEDVELATTYDKSDKNKAVVVMTDGKVTTTAKILGKDQTETVNIKKLDEPSRTYETVKVKDVWIVDTKL
jgi:hypothetical protein